MNVLDAPLCYTDLNNKQYTPLRAAGITTLRDLVAKDPEFLLKLNGVGAATLEVYRSLVKRYGLSLYNLTTQDGNTYISYDGKNGLVFPEEVVAERIDELIALGKAFTVGGTMEISYLRVLVKRGKLKNLVFLCKDGPRVVVDSDGNLVDCPEGFADGGVAWLMELF